MTARSQGLLCDVGVGGTRGCMTGPFGRLTWVFRELSEPLHLPRRRERAR